MRGRRQVCPVGGDHRRRCRPRAAGARGEREPQKARRARRRRGLVAGSETGAPPASAKVSSRSLPSLAVASLPPRRATVGGRPRLGQARGRAASRLRSPDARESQTVHAPPHPPCARRVRVLNQGERCGERTYYSEDRVGAEARAACPHPPSPPPPRPTGAGSDGGRLVSLGFARRRVTPFKVRGQRRRGAAVPCRFRRSFGRSQPTPRRARS